MFRFVSYLWNIQIPASVWLAKKHCIGMLFIQSFIKKNQLLGWKLYLNLLSCIYFTFTNMEINNEFNQIEMKSIVLYKDTANRSIRIMQTSCRIVIRQFWKDILNILVELKLNCLQVNTVFVIAVIRSYLRLKATKGKTELAKIR